MRISAKSIATITLTVVINIIGAVSVFAQNTSEDQMETVSWREKKEYRYKDFGLKAKGSVVINIDYLGEIIDRPTPQTVNVRMFNICVYHPDSFDGLYIKLIDSISQDLMQMFNGNIKFSLARIGKPRIEKRRVTTQNLQIGAMFPGGSVELNKNLSERVVYPQKAINEKIQGTVMVRFMINVDGGISNISVLRPVHPLLDLAAIKVILGMPKWIPAMRNGVPVVSVYQIPITYATARD